MDPARIAASPPAMHPPPMQPTDDAATDAVFDFVAEYLDDLERGGVRPLVEYLAHYPGREEAIAAEYLRLEEEERSPHPEDPAKDPAGGEGRRRVGHYELEREIGSGGQGSVWLARDTHIARRVALKLLIGGFVTEERRRRFRREAESIARLEHPGICHIHEADIDADPPYIAMQLVEGVDLSTSLLLAGARVEGDEALPVPWVPEDRAQLSSVLLFFERVARALHAAHEAGVMHRDIKPGNIVVQPGGDPVLLDFGLARDEVDSDDLTLSGEVFGTPIYMSPEQLTGDHAELDRRTDVYSLGVVLYEALVGERPFQGRNRIELQRAILVAPLPDPRARNPIVTEDVKVVIETAVEKDRKRRYR